MKSNIVKDTIAITVITLVAGLLLGLVHGITAAPIAEQQAKAKEEAYKEVFEAAASFEDVTGELQEELQEAINSDGYGATTIDEVMEAQDAGGEVLGYAFTATNSEGYGGDIQFAIGITEDNTINAISILSISETAGLGMRATTDEFKNQFRGKQTEKLSFTKSGNAGADEIDALSGATITTTAMTNGVNACLDAFSYVKGGN